MFKGGINAGLGLIDNNGQPDDKIAVLIGR